MKRTLYMSIKKRKKSKFLKESFLSVMEEDLKNSKESEVDIKSILSPKDERKDL